MNVSESLLLGFGVVGAAIVGHAAHKAAKNHGMGDASALATSCVASGLAVAVLPAAALGGAAATVVKGVEAFQNRDEVLSNAKLSYAQAKASVLGAADKVVNGNKVEATKLHARRKPAAKSKTASRVRA